MAQPRARRAFGDYGLGEATRVVLRAQVSELGVQIQRPAMRSENEKTFRITEMGARLVETEMKNSFRLSSDLEVRRAQNIRR